MLSQRIKKNVSMRSPLHITKLNTTTAPRKQHKTQQNPSRFGLDTLHSINDTIHGAQCTNSLTKKDSRNHNRTRLTDGTSWSCARSW